MKIIHRSECLSNYPHGGPQTSTISMTIACAGEIARLSVSVDHAFLSQSRAYSKLVRNDATLVAFATGSFTKGMDAPTVAAQLIAETAAALEAMQGAEHDENG